MAKLQVELDPDTESQLAEMVDKIYLTRTSVVKMAIWVLYDHVVKNNEIPSISIERVASEAREGVIPCR